jgi:hypothetical protein
MPRPGREYCQWHDPALADTRAQWQVAGGKSKSNKSRARKKILAAGLELGEIDGALCQALQDVLGGNLEPSVANAAANVAKTISQLRTAADIEKRLEELEQRAGIRSWSA